MTGYCIYYLNIVSHFCCSAASKHVITKLLCLGGVIDPYTAIYILKRCLFHFMIYFHSRVKREKKEAKTGNSLCQFVVPLKDKRGGVQQKQI